MRNYKFYIVALVLLLVALLLFFFSNSSGNLNLRNSQFYVENTNKILEIRIEDEKNSVVLTKENNQWKVNNKFLVKEEIITNFLQAINRLEILYPVSKIDKSQIANLLEKEGVLVEIKKNRFSTLRFIVNPPAMSNDKTYMMMVNSSEPYAVKIPGFKGLVSHLFIPDETFWRNKLVFNFLPQNISVISVEYHKSPDKSFKIKNFNDGSFALSDVNKNHEQSFNVEKVARYFTYFQNIQFEDVISGWTKEKVDSILISEPFIQITVEDINGIQNNIKIFQKKSENGIDGFGEKTEFDLNRAYALLNNNHELLLIQYYVFDPLLKEIDYFR